MNKDLLKLGIKVSSFGFQYWVMALYLYQSCQDRFYNAKMSEIYEEVAEIYNTTPSRVERCMRTSLTPAKEKIRKKYKYNGNISNYIFIKLYCNDKKESENND